MFRCTTCTRTTCTQKLDVNPTIDLFVVYNSLSKREHFSVLTRTSGMPRAPVFVYMCARLDATVNKSRNISYSYCIISTWADEVFSRKILLGLKNSALTKFLVRRSQWPLAQACGLCTPLCVRVCVLSPYADSTRVSCDKRAEQNQRL